MPGRKPWTSDAKARPRPHRFYPPKNNRLVIGAFKALLRRDLRRKLKVVEVEIVGDGLDRLRALHGERCLLTPSHGGGFEPHILMHLSKLLGADFNYLAAQELFEQSQVQRWVLQRLGVYSILRGAVDRRSFTMTRQLLAEGKRWLVIFPEGETIWQGSTVMPFQQGVFQLAFKAYDDALQSDDAARFICVPIAVKYNYLQNMHGEIDASLARLESQLGIEKRTSGESRYVRMRRAAAAILSAIERVHHVQSDETMGLGERIDNLKLCVISRMEQRMALTPKSDASTLDRVRALFNAVDQVVFDDEAPSPYERQLAEEGQRTAAGLYGDLWRLLRFVAIHDGYVRDSMTAERFLDALGLMEAEVFGQRRVWGPRRALVQVGDPIDLRDHRTSYASDRRATVAQITTTAERAVREMLDQLGADSQVIA